MSNLISVYTLLLLLSTSIFTQNKIFIPVNTAEDVIENYVTAIGGRDNLGKLESVIIEGTNIVDSLEIFQTDYISYDIFYEKIKRKKDISIEYFNFDDNTGWHQNTDTLYKARGNKIILVIADKTEMISYRFYWYLYLNNEDNDLTYKFNKSVNDSNTYCIDVIKDKNIFQIAYFNKTNFILEKTAYDGYETKYKEYKEIKKYGIILPYLYESNYTLTITNYKFNSKFDKALLKVFK